MKDFEQKTASVSILGNEYAVKELTLAQKNRLISSVGELIKNLAANAFFRKDEEGSFRFNFIDEVSLADLNIDRIILSSIDVTPELLRLSIPDFTDWDNLPESASREALTKAIEMQDFKGYIANFISAATSLIR